VAATGWAEAALAAVDWGEPVDWGGATGRQAGRRRWAA
jgi:hypothetical protein